MRKYYTCPKCKRNLTDIDFAKKTQYTHSKYINKHICVYCGTKTIIREDIEYDKSIRYMNAMMEKIGGIVTGLSYGSVERDERIIVMNAPFFRFIDNADGTIHKIYNSLKHHPERYPEFAKTSMTKQEDGSYIISAGVLTWFMNKVEANLEYEELSAAFKKVIFVTVNMSKKYIEKSME